MIISILGLAGKDRDGNKTTAFYDATQIDKKSGNYHNSTHFLTQNYPNEDFFFIGTKEAINYQNDLVDFKAFRCTIIEIQDNSLDDIFENIFTIIEKAKDNEKIILDITHGFRHQPISAIFSATLHRFLNNTNLTILFAKQIEAYKKYEYIELNNYLDITELSLLLSGFIRTLNFQNTTQIKDFDIQAFVNFSHALLSNDFVGLQKAYINLMKVLNEAKKNPKFDHLNTLFETIQTELIIFENFEQNTLYEQYLIISKLMYSKNYLLAALTYLFEGFRNYCRIKFNEKGLISSYAKENLDIYSLNQSIVSFISQKTIENYKANYYDKNYPTLYEKNKELFEKLGTTYNELRILRNELTHISTQEHKGDIKQKLQKQLETIQNFIKEDVLKNLQKTDKINYKKRKTHDKFQ